MSPIGTQQYLQPQQTMVQPAATGQMTEMLGAIMPLIMIMMVMMMLTPMMKGMSEGFK